MALDDRTPIDERHSVRASKPAEGHYAPRVVVETSSPDETERLGAELAGGLRAGDVVGVAGELGAGKTTFVRGACRALGVTGPVSSPTFTLGHRYEAAVPVAHLDLYRVDGLAAGEWADLEPYFDGTIAFVEWPEHAGAWLPPARATVTLEHVDESHRLVTIESADDPRL
jgi:tRNA threonylcarbamoyladenosine biosynthesis protein TsaE